MAVEKVIGQMINIVMVYMIAMEKHFQIIKHSEIISRTLFRSVSPRMIGRTVPFAPGSIQFCLCETVSVV